MRRGFLCLPVFLLFALASLADQITLKNGDRLTGKIATGDGKTLLLKTEFVGDVTIQWNAIAAIDSTDILPYPQRRQPPFGKVTTLDGKFVVGGAPESAPSAAKDTRSLPSAMMPSRKPSTPKPKRWRIPGSLISVLPLRAVTQQLPVTLSPQKASAKPRGTNLLSTPAMSMPATIPPLPPAPPPTHFAPAFAAISIFLLASSSSLSPDYETNQLQNLNLRQVYGGGFGYHVIKTDRNVFDVFGGFSYDRACLRRLLHR